MKREDAERLLHHHYRLHTQVRSTIDNKPPKSMFISPKSSHYKPFATRKPKSLEGTPNPPRRRGQEELAHFLAHKHSASLKIPSSLNSSFNAYARKSMSNLAATSSTPSTSATSSRPSTSKTNIISNNSNSRPLFDRNSIRAKILDTRTYQPPLHRSKPPTPGSHSMSEISRSLNGVKLSNGTRSLDSKQGLTQRINQARATTSASATTNGRSSSAMRNNMDLYRHKYKEFKEAVLSDILRRGVFTDRVIKDSFYREIERRTDLDLSQMEMIMFDTLTELGVKTSEKAPAPPPSRAKRPKTAKQRSIFIENGKVIQERAPVVDFSAEPDMYIPDDKTSQ
uniref:Uncharacterized protein n=1 Tax=Panagrolaimus sp. ES5 TaxID=591445 RepID=A0AC34G3C9_9BILA